MKARSLTTDELQQIRVYLESRSCRDTCLFELGVNCGLRVSELINLDIGDVWRYDAPVSRLELTRTKGAKPRAVPLNGKAKASLSALIAHRRERGDRMDDDAPLFLNADGHRLSRRGADYVLRGIFDECRISGKVTTHSLRKTFATTMLNRGAQLRVIQVLLGHSSLATTERYLSVTDDQLNQAVGLLEG